MQPRATCDEARLPCTVCISSVRSIGFVQRPDTIWWVQVVSGRPQARLHSCEGRSPSLVLVQICRIWFAGTSLGSLATWLKRPSLRQAILSMVLTTASLNIWHYRLLFQITDQIAYPNDCRRIFAAVQSRNLKCIEAANVIVVGRRTCMMCARRLTLVSAWRRRF